MGVWLGVGEGGARARGIRRGVDHVTGSHPRYRLAVEVTSPPCLQGVALPFSFPQGWSSASGTLKKGG